jgi:hypothetical protein
VLCLRATIFFDMAGKKRIVKKRVIPFKRKDGGPAA